MMNSKNKLPLSSVVALLLFKTIGITGCAAPNSSEPTATMTLAPTTIVQTWTFTPEPVATRTTPPTLSPTATVESTLTPTSVPSLIPLDEEQPVGATVYRFESQLFGLSVSPVGDMLAIASPVGVYAYSVDPLSELWSRLHNLFVREAIFSPDGDILVSGDEDGLVTLWNANNGEEIVVLPSVIESVSRLAYAVDGNLLAAGGTGGIVSWQLPDRKQENFETNVNAVYGLALSPDSKTLASGTGITITLWDVDSGEQIHSLEGQPEWGGVLDMAFSPDGSVLGAVFGEGIVVLWDAVSWEKISIFKGPSWAYELAYSPDSSVLAVGFYDSSVVLLDVVTGKQVGVLQGPLDWELWGAALYVAYFPDGNTIVAGYSENVLAFWNIESALVNP